MRTSAHSLFGIAAATCNAIMPLSRANGPVTYCITPGVHPPAGSYAFSANIGTDAIAPVMLRFLKLKGWHKVAMIASTDASGQDMDEAMNAALARPEFKGSIDMVAREHFSVSDPTVSAQVARMKAAQPQAIIAWTAGTGFGTTTRRRRTSPPSSPPV
jgi:branched-chain amino acid transport system substrate-binding protein